MGGIYNRLSICSVSIYYLSFCLILERIVHEHSPKCENMSTIYLSHYINTRDATVLECINTVPNEKICLLYIPPIRPS
jgi:hypothetical protein